jgi:hypothetical protein
LEKEGEGVSVGTMVDTLVQQDSPYIYILCILVPQTDGHESLVEQGLCLSVCLSSLSLALCAVSRITTSLASLPPSVIPFSLSPLLSSCRFACCLFD